MMIRMCRCGSWYGGEHGLAAELCKLQRRSAQVCACAVCFLGAFYSRFPIWAEHDALRKLLGRVAAGDVGLGGCVIVVVAGALRGGRFERLNRHACRRLYSAREAGEDRVIEEGHRHCRELLICKKSARIMSPHRGTGAASSVLPCGRAGGVLVNDDGLPGAAERAAQRQRSCSVCALGFF